MKGVMKRCLDLVISLNSDLCVADGDGYSSSIDVDVCHDEAGFPTIPSRRLKGCLKEAACLLGFEGAGAFDELFGVRGSSQGGSLRISDGILVDAGKMAREVLGERDVQDPQKTLSVFTYTRAQTAIGDDGSAKDNTLRFVRAVKQYAPNAVSVRGDSGPTPLRFVSQVSCADDEAQVELLGACCKALRNIGYGRNRGFGAVTCKLVERVDEHAEPARLDIDGAAGAIRVAYTVRLDSALMLPQRSGTESLDFIPGTSVLGYFASQLSGSADFDDLFLRGRVRFSPLYPVCDGVRCRPAPSFVVKVKGGARDGRICSAWQVQEGETVKPLKSGFVGYGLQLVQPATETVYHHSVNVPDDDKTLYTQQCLQGGQLFSGFIEGDAAQIGCLVELLGQSAQGSISFGRSKTAQYARCSLVGMEQVRQRQSLDIRQGNRYVFVFDSDVLLMRDGKYSTSYDDLEDAVKQALGEFSGVFDQPDFKADSEQLGTSLRRRAIMGYNAKWNQKKPHIEAFGAGSNIVFRAASSGSGVPAELAVGERAAEGFGRIAIVPIDNEGNPVFAFDPAPLWRSEEAANDRLAQEGYGSIEELRCATIDYAEMRKRQFGSASIGRAFIGRLIRMAEESGEAADFDKRIASIKSDQKRKAACDLVNGLRKALGAGVDWAHEQDCLILLFTLGKYYAKQSEKADIADVREGGMR